MTEAQLTERLEWLERNNRRLKKIGAAAIVILMALGVIYATRPVPERITAHEFDVVDGAGNIRAAVRPDDIMLFDAGNFFPLVRLNTSGLSIRRTSVTGSPRMMLESDSLRFFRGFSETADIFGGGLVSVSGARGMIKMYAGLDLVKGSRPVPTNSPNIEIRGSNGYVMELGSVAVNVPATGEAQQTSAVSLLMFGNGKRHHVIWRAP